MPAMPDPWFKRYLPSPQDIHGSSALKPFRHYLQRPELWHMHRRSVAGAAFIGLFCAFIPVPAQMFIAAALAIVSRCNLPLAVALVWITNPLTIGPMFFFAYKLGAWLLDRRLEIETIELSWSWLGENLNAIGYPLLFGSLVCGWVSGVSAFVIVRVVWRFRVISQWRVRRAERRLRAAGNGDRNSGSV